MNKVYTFIQAGALVPVTVETVRDLTAFAKHYHDEYWDLLEAVQAAVKAGDWIVDGACDPDKHLRKFKQSTNEGDF